MTPIHWLIIIKAALAGYWYALARPWRARRCPWCGRGLDACAPHDGGVHSHCLHELMARRLESGS